VSPLALTLALLAPACMPGSGTGSTHGRSDGGAIDQRVISVIDGGDETDGNTLPQPDGQPPADTYQPPPDTGPTGPQPPFGTSVGMTAVNFTDIPDCADQLWTLYDQFDKHPAIVLLLNKPS